MFSIARNNNSEATNSCFRVRLMSVSLTLEERFSGSHALHHRFIRNKSVIRTLIYLLFDHLLSGTHSVNVRFFRYMAGARTVIA